MKYLGNFPQIELPSPRLASPLPEACIFFSPLPPTFRYLPSLFTSLPPLANYLRLIHLALLAPCLCSNHLSSIFPLFIPSSLYPPRFYFHYSPLHKYCYFSSSFSFFLLSLPFSPFHPLPYCFTFFVPSLSLLPFSLYPYPPSYLPISTSSRLPFTYPFSSHLYLLSPSPLTLTTFLPLPSPYLPSFSLSLLTLNPPSWFIKECTGVL